MAKILMIEDDPLVTRMYQKVLSFGGNEVITAANGREGLEKAKEVKPSLVLCDVMMPKMNGLEVLERLKADPEIKNIPVIMLTNLSGTQDAQKALSKGALAYLVKSEYKPREVAQKVQVAISKTPAVSAAPATPPTPVAAPQATATQKK